MMGRRLSSPLRALRVLATIAMLAACVGAVAAQGEDEARAGAVAQLRDRDAGARVAACNVLAEVGHQEDVGVLQARLFDADEEVRAVAEAAIWAIWSRFGDKATDKLFTRGVAQMRAGELQKALKTFTDVIAAKPDFTEAWNKRATIYFLLGDDVSSLKDCDEVYKRNPQHFGVLAGYGQIYLRNGDLQRALDYFERADAINPNMPGVHASIEVLRERIAKRGRRYI